MLWTEIKIILTILAITLLPGWALMSLTGYWKKWNVLARWFLAISLGIAFWPILYYLSRAILPMMRIETNKLMLLLLAFSAIIVWKLKGEWKEQFRFDKMDWLVLIVLGITLFSRFVVVYSSSYLAGDDGLHHVLLTEMTATRGILPHNLEPFGKTSLDHYHLGFYAVTAPIKLLSGANSDQVTLWFSQFLSGICGIGPFLLLDKKVSRKAALVGMLAAGLLSPYPSWFINWSRFTQLLAQTIILPASMVFWDVFEATKRENKFSKLISQVPVIEAVFLISAVCLSHFRVAVFLLPLILIISIFELFIRKKSKSERWMTFVKIFLIGLLVLLIILPALLPGLKAYFAIRIPDASAAPSDRKLEDATYYSEGDLDTVNVFWESSWLLVLMAMGTLTGIINRKFRIVSIINLLWIGSLVLMANAYKLNIYALAFTNITAVVLVFYLPISIGVGILFENICVLLPDKIRGSLDIITAASVILLALIFCPVRINDFEVHRAFMTKEDEKAMNWIKENIAADAIIGVNLGFVNPKMPYGTDSGYWLPYYAERKTTTLTLISGLDEKDQEFFDRATDSRFIYSSPVDTEFLCETGIDYLYSGVKEPFGTPDFTDYIIGNSDAILIYNQDGVEIYDICER